jgi:cytochrome c556
LSPVAQAILHKRMVSHEREMRDLGSAILVLDYGEIQAGALRIAADASLSRPLPDDATELNAALPEQFFAYQDGLRAEAKTLAEAAAQQNTGQIANSYGRLSQGCVRCHAAYRAGR